MQKQVCVLKQVFVSRMSFSKNHIFIFIFVSHIQYDNTYLRAAVVSDSGIFIVFGSNFGVIYSTWHITQLNHSMCHTESWAKKKKKKFESIYRSWTDVYLHPLTHIISVFLHHAEADPDPRQQ